MSDTNGSASTEIDKTTLPVVEDRVLYTRSNDNGEDTPIALKMVSGITFMDPKTRWYVAFFAGLEFSFLASIMGSPPNTIETKINSAEDSDCTVDTPAAIPLLISGAHKLQDSSERILLMLFATATILTEFLCDPDAQPGPDGGSNLLEQFEDAYEEGMSRIDLSNLLIQIILSFFTVSKDEIEHFKIKSP